MSETTSFWPKVRGYLKFRHWSQMKWVEDPNFFLLLAVIASAVDIVRVLPCTIYGQAMGAISGFAYAWNLGYQFEISYVVIPAISIIIFYSGVLSKNAKQNWSIGFRTPWALSDKDNWTKTNRLGGTLFQISAVLMTLSLLFSPAVSFIVTMFALFGSVITSYTYSYLIFRK
jgi:uncharacterized membrane protein